MNCNFFSILFFLSILSTDVKAQDALFSWAFDLGGSGYDRTYAITKDSLGNIYSVGIFSGTVDFNPGSGFLMLSSSGTSDLFIQKVDPSGNLVWAKTIGNTTDSEKPNAITVDNSGNVYVTGEYKEDCDFDPSSGVSTLTGHATTPFCFVLKLNSSGNFIWAKRAHTTASSSSGVSGKGIGVDNTGNIYITGTMPNHAYFTTTDINGEVFFWKLDSNGNHIWNKAILGGTVSFIDGHCLEVDAIGNMYIVGIFSSTIDFNPGSAVYNLTPNTNYTDGYLMKLDNNGNFVWVKQVGGPSADYCSSIRLTSTGDLYVAGYFSGITDLDPSSGLGTYSFSSAGSSDAFLLKTDLNGNLNWAVSFGGTGQDKIYDLDINSSGVYSVGSFYNTSDFNPGAGVSNLTSAGNSDGFIQKLGLNGNFLWVKQLSGTNIIAPNTISVNSTNGVYVGGFFKNIFDFDPDSINVYNLTSGSSVTTDAFLLKLEECTINFATDIVATCNSYTWINGTTYTASNNTATHTLTNAAGCDSVVTLNLIINTPTTGTDVQTACNSYTWIDGNTYASSNNTATHTLTSIAGCDSIVTLNLTINTIDTTVLLNGTTLSSNATGVSYQWIDCNNGNSPITGETNQNFTPSSNGNYAVEISDGICTKTSSCFNVTSLGVNSFHENRIITIYPNPTQGILYIDNALAQELQLQVIDQLGRVLISKSSNKTLTTIDLNQLVAGVYYIYFTQNTENIVRKIIKT